MPATSLLLCCRTLTAQMHTAAKVERRASLLYNVTSAGRGAPLTGARMHITLEDADLGAVRLVVHLPAPPNSARRAAALEALVDEAVSLAAFYSDYHEGREPDLLISELEERGGALGVRLVLLLTHPQHRCLRWLVSLAET